MKLQWLDRLPTSLTSDPKKSGVLAVLMLVLAIAGVRAIIKMRPDSAVAAAASAVISPMLSSTPVAPPAKPSTTSHELLAWINSPQLPVKRNLFAIDHSAFLHTSHNGIAAASTDEPRTFWEALEKSRQLKADDGKAAEIRRENIQSAAASLKVQMIVRGSRKSAMIDGKLVREGDVLEPARDIRLIVVQILDREVIVEQQGIRLRVPMQGGESRVAEVERN